MLIMAQKVLQETVRAFLNSTGNPAATAKSTGPLAERELSEGLMAGFGAKARRRHLRRAAARSAQSAALDEAPAAGEHAEVDCTEGDAGGSDSAAQSTSAMSAHAEAASDDEEAGSEEQCPEASVDATAAGLAGGNPCCNGLEGTQDAAHAGETPSSGCRAEEDRAPGGLTATASGGRGPADGPNAGSSSVAEGQQGTTGDGFAEEDIKSRGGHLWHGRKVCLKWQHQPRPGFTYATERILEAQLSLGGLKPSSKSPEAVRKHPGFGQKLQTTELRALPQVVTAAVEQGGEEELVALMARFRKSFVDALQPRHLSPAWQIDHRCRVDPIHGATLTL